MDNQSAIKQALQYLAGVCNYASTLDGSGYNRMDAILGHRLAEESARRDLTQIEQDRALVMLQKYRGQLAGAGIDIPHTTKTTQETKSAVSITLSKNLLMVNFGSIPTQEHRTQMKVIPGWRWNPDLPGKPWSFPANRESLEALLIIFKNPDIDPQSRELLDQAHPDSPKAQTVPQMAPVTSKVKISQDGDKSILVHFPSRDLFLKYGQMVKDLPERKWNPDLPGKPWVVPSRYVVDLIKAFSNVADIDQSVLDLANQHQNLIAMSRKAESDFDVPGMKLPLLPFQRAGVEFIENASGRAIVGDEMGLGKTAEALAYLQLHPDYRPAIIVVPASLKINWDREIHRFMSTKDRVMILSGGKSFDLDLMGGTIYIINYDILSKWIDKLIAAKPAIVIFDEAHLMKNSRVKPKRENAERKGSQRGNAGMDLAGAAKRVLCLTGTPIVNRPIELFPLLNMVAPDAWSNAWRFIKTYCDPNAEKGNTDITGAFNLDDLHNRIKPWFIRRTKDQVLKELPEKRRSTLVVDFDKSKGSDYLAVMQGIKQVIENSEAERTPSNVLAQIERAKQATCVGKLPAAIDWIKNFLDTNGKLVVFATHQFTIDQLMETFGDRAVKVTGETTGQKRQDAVDRFQNDPKVRLFVGNIKAAGVGITLTAASDVAFLEYPWTPGDLEQAADRVHRVGQKNSVTVYYLVADGTIEEDIVELLQSKAEVLGQVHDGKPADLQIEIYGELIKRIKKGN